MNITDIRIRRTYQDARLRAVVSVTIDNDLAIHDIKVIEGPQRLFVAMPSRRDEGGTYRDIAHPISPQARKELEDAVLSKYKEYLRQSQIQELGSDFSTGTVPGMGTPEVPIARPERTNFFLH
jgi:stage V sporulation protein G